MILTWLLQPLLFLFILGPGLESLSAGSTDGVDLTTFMFPGVVCMALVYSAIFSAASLVWDRELGFMREMMVAPVSRWSIVTGKCLGGTTIAASQGVIVLALAGVVHVPYEPMLLLGIFGLQLLIAFTVTAFGVMVATTIKRAQTFTSVVQLACALTRRGGDRAGTRPGDVGGRHLPVLTDRVTYRLGASILRASPSECPPLAARGGASAATEQYMVERLWRTPRRRVLAFERFDQLERLTKEIGERRSGVARNGQPTALFRAALAEGCQHDVATRWNRLMHAAARTLPDQRAMSGSGTSPGRAIHRQRPSKRIPRTSARTQRTLSAPLPSSSTS